MYGSFVASAVAIVFLLGVQSSFVAWAICVGLIAMLLWRWRQMRLYEAAFWESRRKILIWLDGGRLYASTNGALMAESDTESLSDVRNVDALEERGKIVRLLVDKVDGTRDIYAGFDDMEAFAAEFRLNTPQAKFRRVRMGFPMKLKEV